FEQAIQKWDLISQAKSPSAYLFSISRNRLVDHYRKSLLNKIDLVSLDDQMIDVSTKELDIDSFSNEKMKLLYKVLEDLPEQRKEIFKLRKLQGMSTEEVAKKLSISQRTVENQVYRAMASLKKKLTS
ncbi:MAG: sigma-70 family RNA polymerase sigma factor, partial [Bacteroidota bacterium]